MITFASQTINMSHFSKRKFNIFALPFFALLIASSCDKDMNVMLDNSIGDKVAVSSVDSFTVNTATVQLDNLPSSNAGLLLVGKAEVNEIGSVKSSSLFQIGFSEIDNTIPQTAEFESLTLVLRPNRTKYYYGDTTKNQKITVHQVTQDLELTTLTGGIQNLAIPIYVTRPSIFSKQKFSYNSNPIGQIDFSPEIKSTDSLKIDLDQQIGQNLFDLIQNNDLKVSSNQNFREYFKGIALVPDNNNTVILGLSDTVQVKLNYSYIGTDGFTKNEHKELTIVDRSFQYNNIEYDREGTVFETLNLDNKELSTTASSGLTYVQAGTGTVAKLTFPSLKDFISDDKISINKAELIIETSSPINTMYPLANRLMLFVADHNGVPTSFIETPYVGSVQIASFVPGNDYGKNSTYRFNMISYLKRLKTSNVYDETSLYLSVPQPTAESSNPMYPGANTSSAVPLGLLNTFNTAMIAIENNKPAVKLNILYTKFK